MSKLIFKGDTAANFGEYLPAPYIDQITLDQTNDGVQGIIRVELNIFVKAGEEVEEASYIDELDNLNFNWDVGLT